MGRKEDIRAEISSQECKINEYHQCINDLRNIESNLRRKMSYFDGDVYSVVARYDVSCNGTWLGDRADEADSQLKSHKNYLSNLINDGDTLIQDINRAISKYEDMINSCRYRISCLYSELEAILESERRAQQKV